MTFTALIEKSDDGWYVGQLEELPEVLSQGKDVEELKSNLLDALSIFLASNRESVAQNHQGKEIIRESLQMK